LKFTNNDLARAREEVVLLANEAAKKREMYKVLMLALFESCARISEVLSLRLGDVVFGSVTDKEGHRRLEAIMHFKRARILPLTVMANERVTFSDVVWGAANADVSVTLKNTGTTDLSIKAFTIVGVDQKSISPTLDTRYLLKQGNSVTFVASIAGGFQHNVQYVFLVTTSKGNNFGPYSRTAP
jgi:hypothetical protein